MTKTFSRRLAQLRKDPVFRAKQRREVVASHLAIAVANTGVTRAKLAARASIKLAQLSRQLSGEINLTLDSIGRICEGAGLDFDVVYRASADARHVQKWERNHAVVNSGQPVVAMVIQTTAGKPISRVELLADMRPFTSGGAEDFNRMPASGLIRVPSLTRAQEVLYG